MTKSEALEKAQKFVDEMHNKYHLTTGEANHAYGHAYRVAVKMREIIENIDDLDWPKDSYIKL